MSQSIRIERPSEHYFFLIKDSKLVEVSVELHNQGGPIWHQGESELKLQRILLKFSDYELRGLRNTLPDLPYEEEFDQTFSYRHEKYGDFSIKKNALFLTDTLNEDCRKLVEDYKNGEELYNQDGLKLVLD